MVPGPSRPQDYPGNRYLHMCDKTPHNQIYYMHRWAQRPQNRKNGPDCSQRGTKAKRSYDLGAGPYTREPEEEANDREAELIWIDCTKGHVQEKRFAVITPDKIPAWMAEAEQAGVHRKTGDWGENNPGIRQSGY